jgi:NADH-quinone oxidoreductase subunit E
MAVLKQQIIDEIRSHFPRYPTRRAVVLPALHAVQEAEGRVSPEAVVEIARLLELAPAEVQDTLSFYGFFKQDEPVGQYRLWVCRSLGCAVCGGENLLDYLCHKLGIRPGQTTPDGRITLEYAECLGACERAPAILVNDTLHGPMTEASIDALIDSLIPLPPPPSTP